MVTPTTPEASASTGTTVDAAEVVSDVTVLFADLVGFAKYTRRASAAQQIRVLNQVFERFDALAEQHGVQRLKTLGDGYVAIGGVRGTRVNHPEAVADLALSLVESIQTYRAEDGEQFTLRVGVATGPAVSGLVGVRRPTWEVWGETVNLARGMEVEGVDGMVQVARSTWGRLQKSHDFTQRDPIHLPGVGLVSTYILEGRFRNRSQASDSSEPVRVDRGEIRKRLERAEQGLKRLHMVDEVSGLMTPRGFMQMARQQRQLAIRTRKPVLIMMVRIAHFHVYAIHHPDVADGLIATLGALFRKSFRDTDVLARIDDDRFICFGIENEPCDLNAWGARFQANFEEIRSTTARIRVGTMRWRPNKKERLSDLIEQMNLELPP